MGMHNQHDWKKVRAQVETLLKSGKIKPTWDEAGHAVRIPPTTLQAAFRREFRMGTVELSALAVRKMDGENKYDIDPQAIIKILKKRPHSLSELADLLDRGRTTVQKCVSQMMDDHFGITQDLNTVSMPPYTPPEPMRTLYDSKKKAIKFGVFSDPHFGSRHIQASALLRFIKAAHEDYGVTLFLVAGDLTAGYGVYRGQQNDLYAFSADDQVDSLCNTLPQWKDTRYIMIGGNHDYSFMKMNGHNVIQAAAGKRKDFVYAGFDQAEIPLIERDHQVKASAVLWHPSGGVPYALSYRGQKFAAEVTRDELAEVVMDEKPSPTVRFVIWGHLHVADWFPYGPIEVFGPGCFEGTNGYLKAKGLRPTIRGLIVEADIAENGLIASTHIHPLNFMEREDDYHAAYNPMLAREAKMKIEPVFSFQPHL